MFVFVKLILTIVAAVCFVLGVYYALFGSSSIALPIILLVVSVVLMFGVAISKKKTKVARNKLTTTLGVLFSVIYLAGSITSIYIGFFDKTKKVSDVDKNRVIQIWDKKDASGNNIVLGNRADVKKEDGNQKSSISPMDIDTKKRRIGAKIELQSKGNSQTYTSLTHAADTCTYVNSIQPKFEEETYSDVPVLIPYFATGENKKPSVIIIAGEGFSYNPINGDDSQGKEIAEKLQSEGFNAFVLVYRMNPYKFPIPQLDLQRSVQYLTCYADTLSVDRDKISILAYSTGGYIAASYLNYYMGKDYEDGDVGYNSKYKDTLGAYPFTKSEDPVYSKVEVEKIKSIAYVNPLMTTKYSKPYISVIYRNSERTGSKALTARTKDSDLTLSTVFNQDNNNAVKQFFYIGKNDQYNNYLGTRDYMQCIEDLKAVEGKGYDPYYRYIAKNKGHDVKQKDYIDKLLKFYKDEDIENEK